MNSIASYMSDSVAGIYGKMSNKMSNAFSGFMSRSSSKPSHSVVSDLGELTRLRVPGSSTPHASGIANPFDLIFQSERELIQNESKAIISGFLNLGAADGWAEGCYTHIGEAFVRQILQNYLQGSAANKEIFNKVNMTFSRTLQIGESHHPTSSRSRHDSKVEGWQEHAVSRLVGNIASSYQPSKPFFEILINSQTQYPFAVSVYVNEAVLDERRKTLISLKNQKADLAKIFFYHSPVARPAEFLAQHQSRLGVNSSRFLKGLAHLEKVSIKAQTVGNCWMKQPMRSLLVSIYLELLSAEPQATPEESWNKAKRLYKDIQKKAAIPLVESLLERERGMTRLMVESARKALHARKSSA